MPKAVSIFAPKTRRTAAPPSNNAHISASIPSAAADVPVVGFGDTTDWYGPKPNPPIRIEVPRDFGWFGGFYPGLVRHSSRAVLDLDYRENQKMPKEPQFDNPPILYEGNFTDWWEKTELMLIAHGYFTLSLSSSSDTSSTDTAWLKQGAESASLVKPFIRPELLARIPAESQDNLQHLIPALRRHTERTFRLPDLPVELRLKIFEYVLKRQAPIMLIAINKDRFIHSTFKKPALCQTPQLRDEAMEVLFKANDLRMAFNHVEAFPADFSIAGVAKWLKAHQPFVRHLRRFRVQIQTVEDSSEQMITGPQFVENRFSPRTGFASEQSTAVAHAFNQSTHRAQMIRQVGMQHGLEGEMLPLFFMAAPAEETTVVETHEEDKMEEERRRGMRSVPFAFQDPR